MRLNLGRALMSPSDLLLLDEPTNHLDIDTVLWLENWLQNYPGTLLVVSHDRDFLDRIVDRILAILPGAEAGSMRLYTGNYSSYEQQRASELVQQAAFATRQEREIKRIESFVTRFKAKASKARQAQSRMKQLEKMEKVAPVYAADTFHFEFEQPDRQPERIVTLEEVSVGYGERVVLSNISMSLTKNDRIAMIGANGAGKTTLVRMLAGELEPTAGRRTTGRDIVVGYFAQHQIETLRADETPLAMMTRLFRADREQHLRDFLGGFGFAGEAAQRPIGPLSGGEKSRLALAALVRRKPNLLLLDEPTNHLDLEMRRSLSMALQSYEGALIIVSHDRHLLSTCADRIIVVADGALTDFDGDLEDYRKARMKTERVKREDTPKTSRKDERRADAQARNAARESVRTQLKPLEKQLLALETRIAKLAKEAETRPRRAGRSRDLHRRAARTRQATGRERGPPERRPCAGGGRLAASFGQDRGTARRDCGFDLLTGQFRVRGSNSSAASDSTPGSFNSMFQSLLLTAACSSRQTECSSTSSSVSVIP